MTRACFLLLLAAVPAAAAQDIRINEPNPNIAGSGKQQSVLQKAQDIKLMELYPRAKSTTAAGLPTCGTNLTNAVAVVTNALTPALGLAVVGGGAVTVVVKCNGTSWLVGQ